jgi:hypothetical protein
VGVGVLALQRHVSVGEESDGLVGVVEGVLGVVGGEKEGTEKESKAQKDDALMALVSPSQPYRALYNTWKALHSISPSQVLTVAGAQACREGGDASLGTLLGLPAGEHPHTITCINLMYQH